MRTKLISESVHFSDLSPLHLEMDYTPWLDPNPLGGHWPVSDGRSREGFVANYYWNVWPELLG